MDGLDRVIVATIQKFRSQVKSFVKMFLQAGEFIRNQQILNVRLAYHEAQAVDLRTHKCPMCDEVASILLQGKKEPKRALIFFSEMKDQI
jgi:hypothetical protein